MLKIFVTGDNHIGLQYANYAKKDEMVSERLEALSRMVEKANSEGCGLFAVTGDLFENTNVDSRSVRAVVDKLTGFDGTVAVLPGNHDYYDSGAEVWKTFSEAISGKDRIVLLREDRPYEFDGFVIYPAVCKARHSGENCLGWIKELNYPDNGKYRIGMAHGAVEGESLDSEGRYYPMTRDELNAVGADVWLIGHTHVPFPKNLTEELQGTKERIFNAGSHVQTDVKNNTEGLCFIIEIDDNRSIRAKKFASGELRFHRLTIEVPAGKFAETLTRELGGFGDKSYIDVTVKGAVFDDEYEKRGEIIGAALKRFLEADYNDKGLSRLITKEEIEKAFPEMSVYAKMLEELLGNPVQTQLAYDLLTKKQEDKK